MSKTVRVISYNELQRDTWKVIHDINISFGVNGCAYIYVTRAIAVALTEVHDNHGDVTYAVRYLGSADIEWGDWMIRPLQDERVVVSETHASEVVKQFAHAMIRDAAKMGHHAEMKPSVRVFDEDDETQFPVGCVSTCGGCRAASDGMSGGKSG